MGRFLIVSLAVAAGAATLVAQASKEEIEGIRNFTRVDATVACAGATAPEIIPALADRGYKSIINLRLATETGALIDESRAAAEAANMKFIHLPLNGREPEMTVADDFIRAVTDPANQPVYINCGSANRVGALWLAKRILVDKWDEAKALDEAKFIGLSSPVLEKFAMDYIAARR